MGGKRLAQRSPKPTDAQEGVDKAALLDWEAAKSVTISKYCEGLVCTELSSDGSPSIGRFRVRDIPNVEYKLCDAQDLSDFEDGSFDLVFSSNMLEHIPDLPRCLNECKRVLHPEGVMIHMLPSRSWKAFNFLLAPFRLRIPHVHRTSSNHLSEWYGFGSTVWEGKFANAGLKLVQTVRLPFYVGHGNRFIPIIKLGNTAGLSGSFAYILTR